MKDLPGLCRFCCDSALRLRKAMVSKANRTGSRLTTSVNSHIARFSKLPLPLSSSGLNVQHSRPCGPSSSSLGPSSLLQRPCSVFLVGPINHCGGGACPVCPRHIQKPSCHLISVPELSKRRLTVAARVTCPRRGMYYSQVHSHHRPALPLHAHRRRLFPTCSTT